MTNIDSNIKSDTTSAEIAQVNISEEKSRVGIRRRNSKFRFSRKPSSVRPKKSLAKLKSLRPSFTVSVTED